MKKSGFDIVFYDKEDGTRPAEDFIAELPPKKIILTHGFIKKTPKTPPSEIVRAKKYRAEYLSREEHNNE